MLGGLEAGPIFLLLVAGTLGILGTLSGPEPSQPDKRR
jgi:hypothetical protein